MYILGLTGSIGMGKSTVSGIFRYLGVPVHDSDKAIHEMMSRGGEAAAFIKKEFPGAGRSGAVDREALAELAYGDESVLGRLEEIMHPLVRRRQERFLINAALGKRPLAVLDIPLLFETGAEKRCDGVAVVTAPSFLQTARVLMRRGMTRQRLEIIRSRQMPDSKKREKADFIINTGLGRAFSLRAVKKIVKVTGQSPGTKWRPAAAAGY